MCVYVQFHYDVFLGSNIATALILFCKASVCIPPVDGAPSEFDEGLRFQPPPPPLLYVRKFNNV